MGVFRLLKWYKYAELGWDICKIYNLCYYKNMGFDSFLKDYNYSLFPDEYANDLQLTGGDLFEWQREVLKVQEGDVVINGARQSGKSTITSVLPAWTARFKPGSLSIIIAPTKNQASEDILKVRSCIRRDKSFPETKKMNETEIELMNGSRILVLPATDAARGYSGPDLVIMDEASRIDGSIFADVVVPMFTNKEHYLFVKISTPNGKKGFFYDEFSREGSERFEVVSPYLPDPNDPRLLIDALPEDEYKAKRAKDGIKAWYSPRHKNRKEQERNLVRLGRMKYLQEFCGEFVEPEDNVFSYDDINMMFSSSTKGFDFELAEAEPW